MLLLFRNGGSIYNIEYKLKVGWGWWTENERMSKRTKKGMYARLNILQVYLHVTFKGVVTLISKKKDLAVCFTHVT